MSGRIFSLSLSMVVNTIFLMLILLRKKLRRWLENQVKRKDMKYLLIPERHKNGGIHCHALINDCFDMVDSGTRLVTGYNKPVTLKTIDEKKNLHVRNVVYNIPEWKYGFSTAIPVENNSAALAFYITKNILQKGNNKIFGKYYWSSRNFVIETLRSYTVIPILIAFQSRLLQNLIPLTSISTIQM